MARDKTKWQLPAGRQDIAPTVCLHHWHNALPTDNITIQDGNRIRMSPHPTTDNITPTAYRVKPAINHSL